MGGMYFLQLLATSMGTSLIVMLATIYLSYHKVHRLIRVHGVYLLYFRCFVDNMFGVWTCNTTTNWQSFCNNVDNFGILTGDIEDNVPSHPVDFPDLTLMIEDQRIVTETFQKKMNLFLYLPSSSAHPQGCIKGIIYGLVNRHYIRNTYQNNLMIDKSPL